MGERGAFVLRSKGGRFLVARGGGGWAIMHPVKRFTWACAWLSISLVRKLSWRVEVLADACRRS
jgi:hypothetical protein